MPRRRPAGITMVALVLVALAACGGPGGRSDAIRESSGQPTPEPTTTTTTAPPPSSSTSTTTARAAVTTTRPSTTTTRPVGAAATTSTAPPAAKALTPPTAGTYRYDTVGATTVSGSPYPFPAVTTLIVDPAVGTSQHSARNLRDPNGNGPATDFVLDYRPQGVYLVDLRITVGLSGFTNSQDLKPTTPVLLLATGARPGAHSDVALPGVNGARLVVDVLRDERVTVAGQGVDTRVMRATVSLATGDVTGRQELTVNVDPNSRLWVKEHGVADASAGGGLVTLHSDYTATLQRLTPS